MCRVCFFKNIKLIIYFIFILARTILANDAFAKATDDPDICMKTYGRVDAMCRSELFPPYYLRGEAAPFAVYKDDILCLEGDINPENVKITINIMRSNNIKNIFIYSGGGDVDSALDLADEITKHDLDLYVFFRCGSACANYIFLAATRKHILPGSIVSWHGAPIAASDAPLALKKIWEKHKRFFAKIGVNDELTRLPGSCNYEKNELFLSEEKENKTPSWTYRRKTLEDYYHITGIVDMWEKPLESDERDDDSSVILSDEPMIFLFHSCVPERPSYPKPAEPEPNR